MKEIQAINVDLLTYKQDRRDMGDINALSENIKTYGLQHPLLVVALNGKYDIIDGRRRFEACKRARFAQVACIELDRDDLNEDLSLILNTHRLNLSPVELYEMAVRYVKKELKGDPVKLPPEKIKTVARKLNLDVNATCRVLNIGRLDAETRELLASGKLPLRLALLTLRIPNPGDRLRFVKDCIEERPSVAEASDRLRWHYSKGSCADLDNAVFDTEQCENCRHKGQRDASLFEEPVTDEDGAEYCWDKSCYGRKEKEAWDAALKEAQEKLGLTGIKKTEQHFDCVVFSKVVAVDREKCKTCKQVRLVAAYQEGIFPACPVGCANIKQTKRSEQKQEKPKKKDPADYTKAEKKQILEERFAVAARKAMVEHFLDDGGFAKGKVPKDYRRVLFFIGLDARRNPFGELQRLYGSLMPGGRKIVDDLDLKGLAKLNLSEAASHLGSYDRANVKPEAISKAIALLYGIPNWCHDHYEDIAAKLSKRSKAFLADVKPWKPGWVGKTKKGK